MSYLKQIMPAKDGNRGEVHYGRVDTDGIPFRGKPLLLKPEEFEKFAEPVSDVFVRLFDVSQAEQATALQAVIDEAANETCEILRMEEYPSTDGNGEFHLYVYCVWAKTHLEIASHKLPLAVAEQPQTQPRTKLL